MSKKKEKCIEHECTRSVKNSLNDLLILPFEEGIKETQKLFSYFLHNAPDIESVHSKKIPRIKHEAIFDRMLKERHFKRHEFCASNVNINKVLENAFLSGDVLCLKCKRFVCKKKKKEKMN